MNIAKLWTLLLATTFISGCGGSGLAGSNSTAAPAPNAAVASRVHAYGAVTATRSFAVNGVPYDTSAATVMIDGSPGRHSDIALGDIVRVSAKTNPNDPGHIIAETVMVDDAVQGAIAAIDEGTSSLGVLGQTIRVTPMTLFDVSVLPPSIGSLAIGQAIEVSGYRASNGDVLATRIGPVADGGGLETTGVVANLDPVRRRFTINALVVSYAAAAGGVGDILRDGDIVEVRGSSVLPGGELAASYLELAPPVSGASGDRVDIGGYITTVGSPEAFAVAGVAARTTSQTVIGGVDLALDVKLVVKGTLDARRTVVASKLDNGHGGYPEPMWDVSTVAGQVFDAYSGSLQHVQVELWVEQSRIGYSYGWTNGRLATDEHGEFVVRVLPNSQISVLVLAPGFVQPCAVRAAVPTSGVVQVEMVAEATLAVLDPPRPLIVRGTVLTGTVFETVDGVRQPVAGARLTVETGLDLMLATTNTDLQGRFFLCNLPGRVAVYVDKPGFVLRNIWLGDPTAEPLEIEIQRR